MVFVTLLSPVSVTREAPNLSDPSIVFGNAPARHVETGLDIGPAFSYYLDMRILITGERHWTCHELAAAVLNRLVARYGPNLVVVHGGACGVDQSFQVACETMGVTVEPHHADWKGLGNVAGPDRNREMVQAGADLCIALHRSLASSKGTKDCIRQALAAGIPVYLIDGEEAAPKRITLGDWRLASWV